VWGGGRQRIKIKIRIKSKKKIKSKRKRKITTGKRRRCAERTLQEIAEAQ